MNPMPEHSATVDQALDVLVVDDSKAQLEFMESNLRAQGHHVRLASNGSQALQCIEDRLPDVVLLDVVLPDCEGIDLIAPIRRRAGARWIPIILMSVGNSNDTMVRGLDTGADDFLVKPIHAGLLSAKIRASQRAARIHAKLAEAMPVLERYRDDAETELLLARNLIQHMVDRDGLKDPALEWYVLPSAKFSGDIVASTRHEVDRLYVFFADASGHGLAAAISGLPVLEMFYAMAGKGVAVGEIAREMNAKLKGYLPAGRYLAALLLCVDFRGKVVEVWNGGMPQGMVLIHGAPGPGEALKSRQLPLGVVADALFDAACTRFPWAEPVRLLFVSDGLVEATDPAGEPFGHARLAQIAGCYPSAGLVAPILQALRSHLKGAAAHDDVSIFTVKLV